MTTALASLAAREPTTPVITATAVSQTAISIALTTPSLEPVSGIAYYVLYRSIGSAPYTVLQDVSPGAFPFTDNTLTAQTTASYRAEAINASPNADASHLSLAVTATTQAPASTVPTTPQIMASATGSSTISVALTTVSTEPINGVKNYVLQRSVGGNAFNAIATLTLAQWPYTDSALSPSTTYRYQAFAQDNNGALTPSLTSAVSSATTSAAVAPTGLLAYLASLPNGGTNRILSGQHTDYYDAQATTPWGSFSSGSTTAANANINGQKVALVGIGVQGPYNGGTSQQTAGGNANVVALANAILASGAIPHVSMWPGNPGTNQFGGNANSQDLSVNPFPSLLTVGSTYYNNWIGNLNAIAALLVQINGQYIFRPFVELNGTWEWYGIGGFCTGSQFQQLWTITRNYLISKGVTSNCLWNYNINDGVGNYTAGYVAGQVDVVSFDSYTDNVGTNAKNSGCYAALVATGCPVIISEMGNGSASTPDGYSYATTLQDIKTNTPNVVGIMIWCQGWTLASNSGATAYLNDAWIITEPELPGAAPAPASAVGYNTLTHNSTLISPTQYNWYTWNFQGSTVPPSNYTQNADGTISLQDNTTAVAALSSAHSTNNANGFVGVGYGGGMYWEVTATISNSQNNNFAGMAPAALWLVDLEHTSQGPPYTKSWPVTTSTFWPSVPQLQNADGSSGMDDYIEIDMMEYDFTVAGGHPSGFEINMSNWTNHVSGNAINWGPSNQWHQIVGGSSGSTPVPVGTDFGQQHKYGMLWVPATGSGQTTTTQGYLAFYFDRVKIAGGLAGSASNPYDGNARPCFWNYHDPTDYTHYPTPTAAGAPTEQNQGYNGDGKPYPTYGDVCMSILDWRHLMLIMNSGGVQGMTIYSSQVWQRSAAGNLIV
jgi:hypothetical protein